MIIPDKQIHNNFLKYEPIFLEYSKKEQTFTNEIPYQDLKNGKYHAFYILEGNMTLKITAEDGEEKITAVVKHGSFYTLYSKTQKQAAMSSFMSCPSPSVRMLVFTKSEFEAMLSDHPEIALDLVRFYEDLVISLQCDLKDVLFFDGKKRLCDHLYSCYRTNHSLEIQTTQEEIGKYIGLDRTNVSKHLMDLKQRKLVETKRNKIIILDLEGIIELANN